MSSTFLGDLRYYKLLPMFLVVTRVDILNDIISKILDDITMDVPSSLILGDMSPPLYHRDRRPCWSLY